MPLLIIFTICSILYCHCHRRRTSAAAPFARASVQKDTAEAGHTREAPGTDQHVEPGHTGEEATTADSCTLGDVVTH